MAKIFGKVSCDGGARGYIRRWLGLFVMAEHVLRFEASVGAQRSLALGKMWWKFITNIKRHTSILNLRLSPLISAVCSGRAWLG